MNQRVGAGHHARDLGAVGGLTRDVYMGHFRGGPFDLRARQAVANQKKSDVGSVRVGLSDRRDQRRQALFRMVPSDTE